MGDHRDDVTPPLGIQPAKMEGRAVSRRAFARDVTGLVGAQGLITIAAIGTSVITARALGVEGRGHFGIAVLLASSLATFSDFGLGAAGARFSAMNKWPAPRIFGSQTAAAGVRLLATGLIGFVLINLGAETLFPGVPSEYLLLGLVQLIPAVIAGYHLPLLLGLGQPKAYTQLLVVASLGGSLALGVSWALFGLDVRTALLVEGAAGAATGALIWIRARSAAGGSAPPVLDYVVAGCRFGAGIFASGISSFFNSRLVVLLINFYAGVGAVGLFTLAQTATDRIYMLADAAGTLLLPRVAEDPKANSRRLTPIVLRAALVSSVLAATVLAVFADWIVTLLYSSDFIGAVPVLRLLLVAVVLLSGWRVLSQDLNARGHSAGTAAVNWSAALLNVSLAVILLPRLGLEGAGWAAIAAAAWSLGAGALMFGGVPGLRVLFVPGEREATLVLNALKRLTLMFGLRPGFIR